MEQPASLGRYRIERQIGRGAMGRVYLAHDPEIDRKIAIKTIEIIDAQDTDVRERFLREARAAGGLLHPGIVTIFDVGSAGRLLYLAMEYIEGQTLDQFCKPETLLPVDVVCRMIANTAEALHYAHDAGVIHRDIKPANLMRVGENTVKVMDFGLAKPEKSELTHDGALFGTPSYMSPEQIRGEPLDGRSDLFSLAVVLFEMLTGEKPFPGDTISSIIYRIVNEPPREAATWQGRVSPALDRFLMNALSKDRDERPRTGREFAESLRSIGDAVETEVTTALPADASGERVAGAPPTAGAAADDDSLPPRPTKPPRSSALPYIAGVIVLLIGSLAAAYVYREPLGIGGWLEAAQAPPEPVLWQATVRTEPEGLPVELDGEPLTEPVVRFSADGPFGTLTASEGCRVAEHPLSPLDAGGEVVLVLDAATVSVDVDAGIAGASARLNGERVGALPATVEIDLCADNRFEVSADGYRTASLEVPAGSTPLEARTRIEALSLDAMPKGTLEIAAGTFPLVVYVDGKRVGNAPQTVEVTEGSHTVRVVNRAYWVDVSRKVQVDGGTTAAGRPSLPALAELTVQAYPPNCKIWLRQGGGEWKYVDDTPATTRVAAGTYELRVELKATGETRDQTIRLTGGDNPPVRVSFARQS